MVNELFLVVILMVSMGALFTGTSNAKRAGSIGILLVLLLLLPTLNVAWVASVSNEGEDKSVDSRQFPSEYANTQVGIAGDGDRWWLYWVDGKHGALAADLKPITNASVIEWRFL